MCRTKSLTGLVLGFWLGLLMLRWFHDFHDFHEVNQHRHEYNTFDLISHRLCSTGLIYL